MIKQGGLHIKGPASGLSDFTFYCDKVDGWEPGDDGNSLVTIESSGSSVQGRAMLCETADGAISITVRALSTPKKTGNKSKKTGNKSKKTGYKPKKKPAKWKDYGPFSLDTLCCELGELLNLIPIPSKPDSTDPGKPESSSDLSPVQGLLLVTGATNSSKSLVAQGLIHKYLESQSTSKHKRRRLHLVTCEDPVETKYSNVPEKRPPFWPEEIKNDTEVDYTPRSRGKETGSTTLGQALEDALRQTPAVFYAGELRDSDQLQLALEFARTGHFIVATAHAGSLTEAFERLLSAADATTPARRGQVMQRILGVVHQQRFPVPDTENTGAIVPTVWRRTSMGIASMVSEGLSSIVPNNPASEPEEHVFSMGRLWFARRLLAQDRDANHERAVILDEAGRSHIIRESGLSDLNGI